MNDGVPWTDMHALLNLIEYRLKEVAVGVNRLGGGKANLGKYNPKPWVKQGNVMGNAGGRTPEEVMAYLDSLAPN